MLKVRSPMLHGRFLMEVPEVSALESASLISLACPIWRGLLLIR